jgi:predicted DsbA family dithiol-disulfide isomerase
MTNPQDMNLNSANSNGYLQERTRFRVEVSPDTHHTLRETASREGKHMKVLAEEIFQAYFEQQSGDCASAEPDKEAP